ncbi:acyltransferase [Actinomadura fulvescens]|uniref:Acyltransferase 3 domain-containing protein n=1 Tax=Actinomadura fulvescens TaxID=46160 RepID=A0ABP6C6J5_9ACTN
MSSSVDVTAGAGTGTAKRAGASNRDPAIYGIRGMAALALLTVHVAMFSGLFGTRALGEPRPPSNFVGAFFVSGLPSFIGVFFVLPALYLYLPIARAIISGRKRPPQRNAFIRRLFRLLPAYYVMYLVVLLALNRESIDGVGYVLRPILLLQVYLPNPFVPNLMNGMEITWTVPSMVQWYLALPLIAWATHGYARRGATPASRARRLMLPVPILIAAGVGWLFFVKGQGWDNRMVFWWPQGFAPTIGIGMALAILLALSQVSPKDTAGVLRVAARRPPLFWLGALAVYLVNCARPFSVIGMDAIYSTSGLLVTYLMVAMFGLLAALPLTAPGARSQATQLVLGNKVVAHLGRVSYGIYLWHFAVMHVYLQPGSVFDGNARPIRELYGTAGFIELELVTVIGAVLMATLSYYLLERPVSAWADQRFRDRKAGVPALERARRGVRSAGDPTAALPAADAATAELAQAVADRDAIRSNLVDLEGSLGRQLLAGAELTGQTMRRWQTATADLTALWEMFNAYSAVVDDAAGAANGSRRPSVDVAELLTGPSVLLTGSPAPLAQRHITDNGQARVTPSAAVEQMNRLFRRTAELVTAAECAWTEVTGHLEGITADLARVRRLSPGDDTELASAEAELRRLLATLNSDPLSFWHDDRLDTEALDELRRTTAMLLARARQDDGATRD